MSIFLLLNLVRLSLRTADVFPVIASLPPKNLFFWRERRDDQKCICCSQAKFGWNYDRCK